MRLNPSVSRIKTQAKASHQILLGVGFPSLSPNLRPALIMGQAGQGRPLGGPPSSARRGRLLLFARGSILKLPTSLMMASGFKVSNKTQTVLMCPLISSVASVSVGSVAVLHALNTACYFLSPSTCTWTLPNLQSSVDLPPPMLPPVTASCPLCLLIFSLAS